MDEILSLVCCAAVVLFCCLHCYSTRRDGMDPSHQEDEDVSMERQRVMTGSSTDDVLVLYNLKKVGDTVFKKILKVS